MEKVAISCSRKAGQAVKPKIIASIDTFHHMSGITNKLKAYHNFLKDYPKYHHRLVLV
jgi:trehalose-6-phosphate synthase